MVYTQAKLRYHNYPFQNGVKATTASVNISY